MERAVALTIAGSDPSGGAGIGADLKTFHQFGVYGATAITLITVQNTREVSRVEPLPAALVAQQIEAVMSDFPVAAAKTGALGNAAIIEAVAAQSIPVPLVVDPVMISKHGAPLLPAEACEALKTLLLPQATLVTPNIPEAAALTGIAITSDRDMLRAAQIIQRLGCPNVLLKGGHSSGEPHDLLLHSGGAEWLPGRRVNTQHTHGTGCTYSAAITASLAAGMSLPAAVHRAKAFVQRAIETAPGLGTGHGPVNHFTPAGN